jgi:NADH pyrophosphatase NudC (nudix superfamily)
MTYRCPGAEHLRGTPTLKIKICPQCGSEIEIFSTDLQVPCDTCGFIAYNDIQGCIRWCAHAKECVGDEMYEKLLQKHRY